MALRLLIYDGLVLSGGVFQRGSVAVANGIVTELSPSAAGSFDDIFNARGAYVIPGLADVHVHLREPGFSYKETVATGTVAAARGGFTAVCAMPNVSPVPDSLANLAAMEEIIARDARIDVHPYGAITAGQAGRQLTDFAALSPRVCAVSDDGRGVMDAGVMRAACEKACETGVIIAAHCENTNYDAEESEWRMLSRDLDIVSQIRCKYHVCHVSKRESVELIRQAKLSGLDVTAETAPHYLALTSDMVRDSGAWRMNPPLGSAADRAALIEALLDGTIDMIATDHAPHSAEEKSRGFAGSLNGVVGLECAASVVFTTLVQSGLMGVEDMVRLMCTAPRARFGLSGGEISVGQPADLTVFDGVANAPVDPASFASMGRATPFAGMNMTGSVLLTLCHGREVFRRI